MKHENYTIASFNDMFRLAFCSRSPVSIESFSLAELLVLTACLKNTSSNSILFISYRESVLVSLSFSVFKQDLNNILALFVAFSSSLIISDSKSSTSMLPTWAKLSPVRGIFWLQTCYFIRQLSLELRKRAHFFLIINNLLGFNEISAHKSIKVVAYFKL